MRRLLTNAYLALNGLKVVHSLPGRLRLQVPGLKRVPEPYRHLEKELLDLVTLLPGVTSLSLCYVTGRALIHYDAASMDGDKLFAWFQFVWNTVARELADRVHADGEASLIDQVKNRILHHVEAFDRDQAQQ